MVYTDEVRKKLDAILKAFGEYIDGQNEVINDVVNADENKTHIPNALTLSEWEESEVRRRITALLEPLAEDKDSYLQFMDRYLKAYQKNNGYIGEPDEL